jgi:hypothetical protein
VAIMISLGVGFENYTSKLCQIHIKSKKHNINNHPDRLRKRITADSNFPLFYHNGLHYGNMYLVNSVFPSAGMAVRSPNNTEYEVLRKEKILKKDSKHLSLV